MKELKERSLEGAKPKRGKVRTNVRAGWTIKFRSGQVRR